MRFCSATCRDDARRKPLRPMSDIELAWLAGFFDGEGHISIRAQLSQRAVGVKIQVTNTNREILERVQAVTGVGYITTRYRDSARHKPTHDWHTTGGNAKAILRLLIPHLIVKSKRAKQAVS